MAISTHLLLAVVLLTSALVVVTAEDALRRKLRRFRPVQALALGGALVLVPLNLVALLASDEPWLAVITVTFSTAVLLAQIGVGAVSVVAVQRDPHPRRVLAIGAHPDDLELACGGTLARLVDAGHEVHTLILSAGAVGGDPTIRPDEARAASTFLGATTCTVESFPDTRLPEHETEMVAVIEARLKAINADIVLTHSRNDQHQDHVAVHLATMRAARKHPAILCYESPSSTEAFTPHVFVDIDDYVHVKSTAVSVHRDQVAKSYMTPETIAGVAAFRGRQARVPHAEGFEAVRLPLTEVL